MPRLKKDSLTDFAKALGSARRKVLVDDLVETLRSELKGPDSRRRNTAEIIVNCFRDYIMPPRGPR